MDAMTTDPDKTLAQAIAELHAPVEVWQYDDVNGVFATDENGEKVLLRKFCRECSADDVIEAVEDIEWHDGWHAGEVDYPCATASLVKATGPDGERHVHVVHVAHVVPEPIAEDVVWCDRCEEWVTA